VVVADSPLYFASGQLSALYSYESNFGARQVDGYMYPDPALGATDASGGALDGTTGTLTAAGLAAFPELAGPIPFATGTYGYPATATGGAAYTPLITNSAGDALAGIYQHPGTGVRPLMPRRGWRNCRSISTTALPSSSGSCWPRADQLGHSGHSPR